MVGDGGGVVSSEDDSCERGLIIMGENDFGGGDCLVDGIDIDDDDDRRTPGVDVLLREENGSNEPMPMPPLPAVE